MSARASAKQGGASLLELMMVLAITGFALTAIVRFIARSNGTMAHLEGTSELIYSTQRISENMRQSLLGASDIVADYGGSPDFSALHGRIAASIAASSAPKQVTFSAQPVIQNATMADITGIAMANYVGNELFFVSALPPITFTVNLSGTALALTINANTQGYVVSMDRLQFVAFYLTQTNKNMRNGMPALRLVEWRSSPYAVLGSLTQTGGGGYMTGTCAAMVSAGYNLAIDSSKPQDTVGAYWTVSATGLVAAGAAPATFSQASWAYVDEYNLTQNNRPLLPGKNWGQIRGERTGTNYAAPSTFSFAYNSVSSAAVPVPFAIYTSANRVGASLQVPAYATPDRGGTNFPGGFEVLVVGRPGAREVLIRHVILLSIAEIVGKGTKQFQAVDGQDYFTCDTNY